MPSVSPHSSQRTNSRSKRVQASEPWLEIYKAMFRQRLLDEKMVTIQRQGRIGFYGPILGQEAATIASVAALQRQDWVVPALREAAATLYRGFSLEEYIAQLFGNSKDRVQGRQMPCHHTYREGNYVAMSSCIGTQLTHAVGIAMAAKYRKDPAVVLAYLGDGATSEGEFHAAMNFAGVYQSPVVFFCQNNHWAISVPAKLQTASKNFAMKASAYGLPGIQVDGNDAVAVYQKTRKAVENARSGKGPVLIEAITYRMSGHTTSDDPSRYRSQKEVEAWGKKDPVLRMRKFLEKKKLWNASKEKDLKIKLSKEIADAVKKVEKASPPPLTSMFTDVYADMPPHLREQMEGANQRKGSLSNYGG